MDVTDQQLQAVKAEWPVFAARWPRPTDTEDAPMSRHLASAYGRLATRTSRRVVMLSQLLGLVGGAWLGAFLPTFARLVGNAKGFAWWTKDFWQFLVVGALIEISLLAGDHARDLEAMAEVYHRYAKRPDDAPAPPTEPNQGRLGRFLRSLKR